MSSCAALDTDFYEIAMMAGFAADVPARRATFELYVRHLPPNRGYLVAAGLEQALEYLEGLRFTPAQIDYLRAHPALAKLPARFFEEYLPAFRFTGDVWAMPEGTPVFALEPIVRVTAPAAEAQLVETALLAIVGFQTSVASKAVRVVDAAAGRPVVEFGGRRAHGLQAATLAARAAFIGGCVGTSNVEAGFRFGIPVSGTMAHSWVMAHADEMEAFRAYLDRFGERTVLLIDTYDTVRAAQRIAAAGLRPSAVRLDSGDAAVLSREVRRIFDEAGLTGVRIFSSGDLDELRVAALVAAGAPIDAFGVGTAISTSSDAPALGAIYKLVEIVRDGRVVPVMKLSPDKRSYPGRKQVWRVDDGAGMHDVLGLHDEEGPARGRPLLCEVMREGRRVAPADALPDLQAACRAAIEALPPAVRRLESPEALRVEISRRLDALAAEVAGLAG